MEHRAGIEPASSAWKAEVLAAERTVLKLLVIRSHSDKIAVMNELEKMQKLHLRSVLGEKLSNAEKAALKRWYDANDKDEGRQLNSPTSKTNSELRENLDKLTRQITKISGEVEALALQNAQLSKKNKALSRSVEARLLEKAA